MAKTPEIEVIEIGNSGQIAGDLKKQVEDGVGRLTNQKYVPYACNYDEVGLQLFVSLCSSQHYYPPHSELCILTHNASQIVAEMCEDDAVIFDLGSGNLTKSAYLLHELDKCNKSLDYYAVDISKSELVRSLDNHIATLSLHNIKSHGLRGTYQDFLPWLTHSTFAQNNIHGRRIIFWWLGISIGNYTDDEVITFVADLLQACPNMSQWSRKSTHLPLFFVSYDTEDDLTRLTLAYNDGQALIAPNRVGISHSICRNTLITANRIVGKEIFRPDSWDYCPIWDVTEKALKLCAWCIKGYDDFKNDEMVVITTCRKRSQGDIINLLSGSGWLRGVAWKKGSVCKY